MSRVFVSERVGAGVYVFSDDHCPPHVHARHRGEGWMARIGFSFIVQTVHLISIAPMRNIPLQRAVNNMLDDVAENLALCRRHWWEIRGTVCLTNQWGIVTHNGAVEMASPDAASARQIASATYHASAHRLDVTFRDGSTTGFEV
jgi:hypothetical protein